MENGTRDAKRPVLRWMHPTPHASAAPAGGTQLRTRSLRRRRWCVEYRHGTEARTRSLRRAFCAVLGTATVLNAACVDCAGFLCDVGYRRGYPAPAARRLSPQLMDLQPYSSRNVSTMIVSIRPPVPDPPAMSSGSGPINEGGMV
jgi:hypothetical protein